MLNQCKSLTREVFFVGYTPVNESLTTPKMNPFDNSQSYFFNDRIKKFDVVCEEVCEDEKVKFISLFDNASLLDWNNYLALDGLYLNDSGHKWVFEQVWKLLNKFITL